MAVSFIGAWKRSNRRTQPTCHMSLTNIITYRVHFAAWDEFKFTTLVVIGISPEECITTPLTPIVTRSDTGSHNIFDLIPIHYVCNLYISYESRDGYLVYLLLDRNEWFPLVRTTTLRQSVYPHIALNISSYYIDIATS